MNYIVSFLILFFGIGIAIFRQCRNEWILNQKLKVMELTIKKRYKNQDLGKPYFLCKEVEAAMWSYEKMVWYFWVKDMKDMFNDRTIRNYIYGD